MTASSTLTILTTTTLQQSKRCTMIRGIFSSIERQSLNNALKSLIISRRITNSASVWARPMPPRPPAINEEDFTEKFLCGTGPGGQKINKTSSAVQLKHIPTGLVLKVQATRSRIQNRKIARQMLAERIEVLERGDKSRAAVVAESKKKKKSSAVKKSKRKYRALAEAKEKDASLNIVADSEPKEP